MGCPCRRNNGNSAAANAAANANTNASRKGSGNGKGNGPRPLKPVYKSTARTKRVRGNVNGKRK